MTEAARRAIAVVTLQLAVWLLIVFAVPSAAEQYSARQRDGVIQLEDSSTQTVVSIVPSVGNVTFAMKVKGQEILRFPYASVAEFRSRPGLAVASRIRTQGAGPCARPLGRC